MGCNLESKAARAGDGNSYERSVREVRFRQSKWFLQINEQENSSADEIANVNFYDGIEHILAYSPQ